MEQLQNVLKIRSQFADFLEGSGITAPFGELLFPYLQIGSAVFLLQDIGQQQFDVVKADVAGNDAVNDIADVAELTVTAA